MTHIKGKGKNMKFIRSVVGRIILFVDFLTRPKPIFRNKDEQDKINNITFLPTVSDLESIHKFDRYNNDKFARELMHNRGGPYAARHAF